MKDTVIDADRQTDTVTDANRQRPDLGVYSKRGRQVQLAFFFLNLKVFIKE